MIERVVRFALANPLFVVLGTALFVGGGVAAFKQLPVEAFPDVTDTQVNVITLFPGRAAEEVERQVTIPLEVVLAGIPNSVRLFSHTQFGLSFVILTFNDKADPYFARQQVVERLRETGLPEGVQPELAPLSTPIGEVYRYVLKSTSADSRELRSLQDWVVVRQLRLIPGVADVISLGGLVTTPVGLGGGGGSGARTSSARAVMDPSGPSAGQIAIAAIASRRRCMAEILSARASRSSARSVIEVAVR